MKQGEYTQQDDHNMADMIWWISGYMAANKEDSSAQFQQDHIDTPIKMRLIGRESIHKGIALDISAILNMFRGK